jgi:hypothetical protein
MRNPHAHIGESRRARQTAIALWPPAAWPQSLNLRAVPSLSITIDWRKAMPLNKGKSSATVSSNIKMLVDDWKKHGSIGTSHPEAKKNAITQAVAIALNKAGKSRQTQSRGHKAG